MSDSESILESLTGSIVEEFLECGCRILWVEGRVRGLIGRFGEENRVELVVGGRLFVSKNKENMWVVGLLRAENDSVLRLMQ